MLNQYTPRPSQTHKPPLFEETPGQLIVGIATLPILTTVLKRSLIQNKCRISTP